MIGGKVRSSKRRSPAKRNTKRKSTKRSPAKRNTKRKSTKRSPAKRNTKRKYKNKQRGGVYITNFERQTGKLQKEINDLHKEIDNIDYNEKYLLSLSETLSSVNNSITVPSKQTNPSSSWWNIFSSNNSQQEETNNDNITLLRRLSCNIREEAFKNMKELRINSRKLDNMIYESPCDEWTYEHSKNVLDHVYTLQKEIRQKMRNKAVEKLDSLLKEYNLKRANYNAERTYNSVVTIYDIAKSNFVGPATLSMQIFEEGQKLQTPEALKILVNYVEKENPISNSYETGRIKKLIENTEEAKNWRNKVYLHLKDIQSGNVRNNMSGYSFHSPSKRIPYEQDKILNFDFY